MLNSLEVSPFFVDVMFRNRLTPCFNRHEDAQVIDFTVEGTEHK